MDSAQKIHWWQKKAFWLAVAGVAAGVAVAPGIPAIVVTYAAIVAAVAGGIGTYGAVEVARSNAKANSELAAAKKEQVALLKAAGPKP